MTLLVFIIILSILVLIHEFGHFYVAKKNGVRVEEFGWGLPPRIYGKRVGDTVYSVNWLPFGGFVRLAGEDSTDYTPSDLKDSKNYISKSPLQRFCILVAGVFMNLVLAVFLYYVFLFVTGFRTFEFPVFFDHHFRFGTSHITSSVVAGFSENSPASSAGINVNEAIVSINDTVVSGVSDVRRLVADKVNVPVKVTLRTIERKVDATETHDVYVTPVANEEGQGVLGVYLSSVAYLSYDSLSDKLLSGFYQTYNMTSYSLKAFYKIFAISAQQKSIEPVSQSVSGPIGIYNVVGHMVNLGGFEAFLNLIEVTALLSVSLVLLNIFPFPALDGGRILFVLLEMIRGKRLAPALEATIHKFGMFVLFGLIILVTIKDFFQFF